MAHGELHDPIDAPARRGEARAAPNVVDGIIDGVLGGLVIAVFFFAVDLVEGHPLWTPATLGAPFFQGQPLADGAAPPPSLVAGYTVMHTTAFIAIGLLATYLLQIPDGCPRHPPSRWRRSSPGEPEPPRLDLPDRRGARRPPPRLSDQPEHPPHRSRAHGRAWFA